MKNNIISLGGWCGPRMALGINPIGSLPFDNVRSTFKGILDCIENDFNNYFPTEIKENYFNNYLGKYIGFYHHDLKDNKVIESFKRKIERFKHLLQTSNEIIFLRTIIDENYENELILYQQFSKIMSDKYPNLKYILCFIIHDQIFTGHILTLNSNIIVCSIEHIDIHNLTDDSLIYYKKILYILSQCKINTFNAHLFKINHKIEIQPTSKLWYINNIPIIDKNN